MVIVTGSIRAQPEHLRRVLQLGLEHVHRSRQEPGCQLHSVHQDAEDPNRLVFLEHWDDLDSLRAHFAVPESSAFVRQAAALAVEAPTMSVFEATPVAIQTGERLTSGAADKRD